MKINLKTLLFLTLCIILIGIGSGIYLYTSLINLIGEKEGDINRLYLETVRNQLDYQLAEITGLSQCRNDLEIAGAMSLETMETVREKRAVLQANEKLNAYLSSYRLWRYIDKLMVFNESGITIQAITLGSNRLDDADRVRQTDIFGDLLHSGETQMIGLSSSITDGRECIALVCRVYDVSASQYCGWLYMEINTAIVGDTLDGHRESNLYITRPDGSFLLGTAPDSDRTGGRSPAVPLSLAGLTLVSYSGFAPTAGSVGSIIYIVFVFLLTTLLATVLLTALILSLFRESEALRMYQKNAEIALLQSQVNPHFLYNTLESILWLAGIQKNTGITKITRCLISLLKNLAKGVGEKITLGEEIALLNDYAELQSIRYMDVFSLVNKIPEHFYDCVIIKFSLQPLVENAIFHGIVPSERCGAITLDAVREGDDLIISVEDNGIGIEPPDLKELSEQMERSRATGFTGIGLSNVNNRFKLSYGEQYGLTFESKSGHFTRVMMRFPIERRSK